jgi:hypothetical protein
MGIVRMNRMNGLIRFGLLSLMDGFSDGSDQGSVLDLIDHRPPKDHPGRSQTVIITLYAQCACHAAAAHLR